ncbi:tripartite tricarboxylate transporter TctB family protein [Aquisalimonas asiatica]|uniref:Putative tricarboxylic transport membrane protein n=1 Tax=Aquisalimonas asiatica TaxID=406100 RepID=A0A1H8SZ20_9GAMM|nr:tripartite tricarboxylate transporter TctB family protein [Aquisalimonas asiatica]SEO83897.1 putative tricarboxylic transport membrane protein [Aquisalimonas asiatica]
MARLNVNQILAIVLAVIATAYLVIAFQIPSFPVSRPVDSDLFPKILGTILLVLSGVLYFERPNGSAEAREPHTGPWWQAPDVQVLVTVLAMIGYALSLEALGFVLASTVFCVGLTAYYGFRRHLLNVVVALSVVLGLYLTMTRVLDVYLPRGVLPF